MSGFVVVGPKLGTVTVPYAKPDPGLAQDNRVHVVKTAEKIVELVVDLDLAGSMNPEALTVGKIAVPLRDGKRVLLVNFAPYLSEEQKREITSRTELLRFAGSFSAVELGALNDRLRELNAPRKQE